MVLKFMLFVDSVTGINSLSCRMLLVVRAMMGKIFVGPGKSGFDMLAHPRDSKNDYSCSCPYTKSSTKGSHSSTSAMDCIPLGVVRLGPTSPWYQAPCP